MSRNLLQYTLSPCLIEKIRWAIRPFPNSFALPVSSTGDHSITELRKIAHCKEKHWGNKMLGHTDKSNWSALLGESLVYDILTTKGDNPRKSIGAHGFRPDFVTDNCIYEVKTRNWTTRGSIGEKLLGCGYKYSDIPELTGKPLKIVCVAYQEWELTYGPLQIFGEIDERKKHMIDMMRYWGIEYVKCSDLINDIYET